jgi:FAD synthase
MKKNNVMTIRVPQELKERIENVAILQGVSINQFAVYAFTKELAELENSRYFKNYLRGKKKEEIVQRFDEVMEKIQPRELEEWDQLEEQQ